MHLFRLKLMVKAWQRHHLVHLVLNLHSVWTCRTSKLSNLHLQIIYCHQLTLGCEMLLLNLPFGIISLLLRLITISELLPRISMKSIELFKGTLKSIKKAYVKSSLCNQRFCDKKYFNYFVHFNFTHFNNYILLQIVQYIFQLGS